MKKTALIGYTGFVGSNLANQLKFNDLYNSKNIKDIQNKEYNLIVCAGTKAEVWKANQNSEEDWNGIKNLLDNLASVKAKHFILISTILVYPTVDADENVAIDINKLAPYGKHRYQMELAIRKIFPKVTFIRLPQLYGPGIKKNFVFDLIHDNALDFTHKDTSLQWYNLKNLWKDIQIAVKNNIDVINFAVEPISARELAKYTLEWDFQNITEKPPLLFNFQTKHGSVYGSKDKYLYHKKQTLGELKHFIVSERKRIDKPVLDIIEG